MGGPEGGMDPQQMAAMMQMLQGMGGAGGEGGAPGGAPGGFDMQSMMQQMVCSDNVWLAAFGNPSPKCY